MDLSSATDRFPIEVQLQVLSEMGLNEIQISSWRHLMVGLPYMLPGDTKDWKEHGFIHYSVGQPMGGRSS